MIKFGPSGNSPSFYEDGNKTSLEAPKWLKQKDLKAYEYSFGRGYTMSLATAEKLGEEAKKHGIEMSIHAPYYINFANTDKTMKEKSFNHITKGLEYCKAMNATHFVFHIASQGKLTREEAVSLAKDRVKEFFARFNLDEYPDTFLCPETMGKYMQIGTYEEIIDICALNEKLVPTFDFGHINCTLKGELKTKEDYIKIFKLCIKKLGQARTSNCHIHFSKIQYGDKGEIKHLNYDDEIYGPDFEPLAKALKELKLSPTIICESKDFMAEDALILKKIYENV